MRDQLVEKMMEPLPSEQVKRFFQETQDQANQIAEEAANSRQVNIAAPLETVDPGKAADQVRQENEKIISLQREKFNRIH